ncbi:MAG: sensor histidine kinase, partial [Actinomycetota bacterium]|nr:sensor histidine kinase [Actinomycetota bacterium]
LGGGAAMSPRRIAWGTWTASVVLTVVWALLDTLTPTRGSDPGEYAFVLAAVLLYATVGALITSRQLGNRVGLLFSWIGLIAAAGLASGAYATFAHEVGMPFVAVATWFARVAFAAMIGPLAFLFLIFPTGSPPSRRWGWLLRAMAAAYVINILLFALTPGRMDAGFAELHGRVDNPLALPVAWQDTIEAATAVAGLVVFAGAIVSVVSLIQRYRRASPSERLQIRWLAFLGVSITVWIVVFIALDVTGVMPEDGPLANVGFIVTVTLIFLAIPITCAVAILKHGLWDLDVVVKKTVQYGVLVAASIAVIGLVLVGPTLLAIGVPRETLPGIGIGLGVAVVFAVLRPRAQRFANRVVYRKRSTPYEVLSEFAERAGETYSTEDVLPQMAQLLGEATGARAARVWLKVDGTMRPEAAWPADAPPVHEVPSRADALPAFAEDHAFEVRHRAELLGALTLTEAPDDPMTPSKARLVRDMAAQAGLVLRNVRLIEDLRESRRRIVAAQDERAKKLERDIHDGAQQQLVALSVKLRLAGGLVQQDPDKARAVLTELQGQATDTLEDLRDLARGIYPPLLADKGLPAALEAQARRSSIPVRFDPDGVGRYREEVESAIYFSCLEALNNVAKYADASTVTIRLLEADGELRFEVRDDGRGFDPAVIAHGTGLRGMADRVEAVGGRLEVRSAPGGGTTVAGSVPVSTEAAP